MTRRRQTVPVKFLRDRINTLLQAPSHHRRSLEGLSAEQAYRMGAASVLEAVLHETGNYAGFGYLDVDHTVDPPRIPDETRRAYYTSAIT